MFLTDESNLNSYFQHYYCNQGFSRGSSLFMSLTETDNGNADKIY